jgi:hypothetical protein
MSDREEFLSGERPDDVALFLADSFVSGDKLADYGESVPGGLLLVVPGETGRNVFKKATGMDAMSFAKEAMGTEGTIAADLAGGDCPEGDHDVEFVFAFGGLYAEGDVVHAYAYCSCGTAFSQKWVAGER